MSRKRKTKKKPWRPRVLWQRKPQTQVVPNRKHPSRQKLKQQAKAESEEAREDPEPRPGPAHIVSDGPGPDFMGEEAAG